MNLCLTLRALLVCLAAASVLLIVGCNGTDRDDSPAPVLSVPGGNLLDAAMESMDAREYTSALALVDSASALNAPTALIAYARGSIFLSMGRLDEAELAFREVLDLDPGVRGAWLNLGNIAFRRNQFEAAVDAYKREARRHPGARPHHAIGAAYWELANADSARSFFERAIDIDDAYAPALYSMALLQDAEGDAESALALAERASQLAPNDQRTRALVGRLQLKLGRISEAILTLGDVVGKEPWNYEAMFSLGQAQRRAGLAAAAATLARSEELRLLGDELALAEEYAIENPNSVVRRIRYADLLRRLGRYGDALQAYQVAAALEPDNVNVVSNVATLKAQSGDRAGAVVLFADVLRRDSTHASSWLNLGLIYRGSGQDEAAHRAFAAARRHADGDERILGALARLEIAE